MRRRRAAPACAAGAALLLAGCAHNTFVTVVRQPLALSDPNCDAPHELPPITGPAVPVALGVADYPRRATEARIGVGCAGVLFRVTADGRATDLRVMMEDPPGLGFGEAVVDALGQTRFRPNPDDTAWHYSNSTLHLPPSEMPRPYPVHPPGEPGADEPFRT